MGITSTYCEVKGWVARAVKSVSAGPYRTSQGEPELTPIPISSPYPTETTQGPKKPRLIPFSGDTETTRLHLDLTQQGFKVTAIDQWNDVVIFVVENRHGRKTAFQCQWGDNIIERVTCAAVKIGYQP